MAIAGTGAPRPLNVGAVPWFVHNFASQDWLMIGYFCALLVALAFGKGPNRAPCIVRVSADFGIYFCVLTLVRLPVLRWGGLVGSVLYRTTVTGTLLASFFQLREILPAVSSRASDARIYAFDMSVFGVEPAAWLDRFVSPATTEWFAFFYFLYFFVLTVHIVPMLFWQHDLRVIARFALGVLLLFTTAHILYMVVPGWGHTGICAGPTAMSCKAGCFGSSFAKRSKPGARRRTSFRRFIRPSRRSWPFSAFGTVGSRRSSIHGRSWPLSLRRSSWRRCSCAGTIWSTSSPE